MSLKQEIEEKTGKEEKHYAILINNFKINLSKGVPKFENYDTINESKKLKIFSNFYFPIEIAITTYEELESKQITYTQEQLKEKLITDIQNRLKEQISNIDKIVNTQINEKKEGDTIEIEVIYEVLENIGTNEKIVF